MDNERLEIYYMDGTSETILCREFDFDSDSPDILAIDIDDDHDVFIQLRNIKKVKRTILKRDNILNY